jgi:hypothetical protein
MNVRDMHSMGGMKPEDAGIFRGFNIEYPEYTVVTPQTGMTFQVRSLTVAEVNKLKASGTTPSSSTELINKTLWGAITSPPQEIKSYEDFLKLTTLKDREAVIYGMYVMTFGDERDFNVVCSECGADRQLKIHMSDMFSMTPYPGTDAMSSTYEVQKASGSVVPDLEMERIVAEKQMAAYKKQQEMAMAAAGMQSTAPITAHVDLDPIQAAANDGIGLGTATPATIMPVKNEYAPVQRPADIPIDQESKPEAVQKVSNAVPILEKEISVPLPISKVVAIVYQPTLNDEWDILKSVSLARREDTEVVNETLIVKRFEVMDPRSKQPVQVIERREDILKGYQSLPHRDRMEISKAYRENFADYGVKLQQEWECFKCGAGNELNLDIVVQFFRMVTVA